ncbi:MAG: lipid-A-disaccharide synthase [Alphaproteobacteria bacterium]|nr:lipid-A-disaccharide synthase [Alphaproteobacteria bacterium]
MLNKKNIKVFIIAGEVSGDVLGAKIMREMSNAQFIGIGGENMQVAGLKSIFPISDLAVMGLVEVLAHAKTLTNRINQTVNAIIESKPDLVLTIDSPSFAKQVIKKFKSKTKNQKLKIKFYHVVAPQVWAWGASRAKKFAGIFDRLYSFFDFEVPYFTKYGLPTIPVGHPIADGLNPEDIKNKEKIISLIPGSRMSEVKKLLPIFKQVAEKLGNGYKFSIPTVETTVDYIKHEVKNWNVHPDLVPASKRYELYAKTYIAIVASGTVSAELAIMHIPTIVVYKMNPLTTFLARIMVKTKWVSLVNILLQKTVYPELLGNEKATPENIIYQVKKLSNPVNRKKMILDLSRADKMWRKSKTKTASQLIVKDIEKTIK